MRADRRLRFSGSLTPSFLAFARERAARLDLALDIGAATETAVVLRISGQEEFVCAFELACSLGPIECLVEKVERI